MCIYRPRRRNAYRADPSCLGFQLVDQEDDLIYDGAIALSAWCSEPPPGDHTPVVIN